MSENADKTIMVVEDSPTMRQMVGFTLKRKGYSVVEAVDGKDALVKLNGKPMDMIITDVNMPNLDGIELVKAVRANDAHKFTPIIVLTTESQDSRKLEGKSAGATGWIVKPFSSDHLLAIVDRIIG